ncbi:hypothetical protein AX17_006316 [Amanita inopinata Kibby_2008]|nr:hypothetical protein AX17_006316 [Amanita inopinata Kibby_2008]
MATITYTIYSHYDPKHRERLLGETGQLDDAKEETEESWKTEPPKYRNLAPAPQFVAATVAYDSYDFVQPSSSRQKLEGIQDDIENETVNWYRSLRKCLAVTGAASAPQSYSAPASAPRTPSPSTTATQLNVVEKRDKNNWFIMNAVNAMKAIKSEPSSSRATPKPPPTLADMLARDPPPKPHERQYVPPVWLEIGPSNRGFVMLQKSGWSEGEALGPDTVRRKRGIKQEENVTADLFGEMRRRKGRQKERVKSPVTDTDVIDLTLSDSESEEVADLGLANVAAADSSCVVQGKTGPSTPTSLDVDQGEHEIKQVDEDEPAYGRKALLTPLATVLKSDRLGIGLKAKKVGPYKASLKRVTHNAAALATHVKAAEEVQKRKKESGRGCRGFERQRRKEEMKRQMMLAYMNS